MFVKLAHVHVRGNAKKESAAPRRGVLITSIGSVEPFCYMIVDSLNMCLDTLLPGLGNESVCVCVCVCVCVKEISAGPLGHGEGVL